MIEDSGWVIEKCVNGVWKFWNGKLSTTEADNLTPYPNEAIRFARLEDATKFLKNGFPIQKAQVNKRVWYTFENQALETATIVGIKAYNTEATVRSLPPINADWDLMTGPQRAVWYAAFKGAFRGYLCQILVIDEIENSLKSSLEPSFKLPTRDLARGITTDLIKTLA